MRTHTIVTMLFISPCLVAQDAKPQDAMPEDKPTVMRMCIWKEPVKPCIVAPVPVLTRDPEYTEEARSKKVEGVVHLTFVVGVDGKTRDVRITKSLESGLDENALEAVKLWTFKPGTLEGKVVAVQLQTDVAFHLL